MFLKSECLQHNALFLIIIMHFVRQLAHMHCFIFGIIEKLSQDCKPNQGEINQ